VHRQPRLFRRARRRQRGRFVGGHIQRIGRRTEVVERRFEAVHELAQIGHLVPVRADAPVQRAGVAE